MKRLSCLLLLGLGACQAFTRPDVPATLRAENAGFIVEATNIVATAQAQATSVQATAVAAQTIIARTNNINQQMMATARAVIPPTPQIAGADITSIAEGVEGMQFVEVGTTTSVRDSDGCADGLQSQFAPDTGSIYITTRALNIQAGTLMGVEWRYDGEIAYQENFVVPVDDDNYCIWFNIVAPFSAGNWTVRLFENEVPIEPEVAFTVEGVTPEGG